MKNYKKNIYFIILVLIISASILIFQLSQNKNDQKKESIKYDTIQDDQLTFRFKLPITWKYKVHGIEDKVVEITDDLESFKIHLISTSVDPSAPDYCAIYQDCISFKESNKAILATDNIYNDYYVIKNQNSKIRFLVPKLGLLNLGDYKITTTNIHADSMSNVITYIDDQTFLRAEINPITGHFMEVLYEFKTQEGVNNWELNREVLIKLLESLENR